jgi:hypothetical protein
VEERCPRTLTIESTLPEQVWGSDVVNDRCHGAGHIVRLAQADETVIGVNLDPKRPWMLRQSDRLDALDRSYGRPSMGMRV